MLCICMFIVLVCFFLLHFCLSNSFLIIMNKVSKVLLKGKQKDAY